MLTQEAVREHVDPLAPAAFQTGNTWALFIQTTHGTISGKVCAVQNHPIVFNGDPSRGDGKPSPGAFAPTPGTQDVWPSRVCGPFSETPGTRGPSPPVPVRCGLAGARDRARTSRRPSEGPLCAGRTPAGQRQAQGRPCHKAALMGQCWGWTNAHFIATQPDCCSSSRWRMKMSRVPPALGPTPRGQQSWLLGLLPPGARRGPSAQRIHGPR